MHLVSILILFVPALTAFSSGTASKRASANVCTVPAAGDSSIDDTPAVLKAFKNCGHGGKIVFENTTYHINSVMNTTGLENCEIDLQGTLLVGILTVSIILDIDTKQLSVEHEHLVLAQPFSARGLPESIHCLDYWGQKPPLQWTWIRHF